MRQICVHLSHCVSCTHGEARFAIQPSVVCTPWLLGAISHLESIMYMVHLVECTIVLYVENNHFDVGSRARLLLSHICCRDVNLMYRARWQQL